MVAFSPLRGVASVTLRISYMLTIPALSLAARSTCQIDSIKVRQNRAGSATEYNKYAVIV
jgi:hypothetical protein